MKKLLALLAVLGMVNVASAAYTFVQGADVTQTVSSASQILETYYLIYDGTGTGVNALDLKIVGPGNISINRGTGTTMSGVRFSSAVQNEEELIPTAGRTGIDVLSLGDFNVGTKVVSPLPTGSGFFFVDMFNVAFAQATNFTKLNIVDEAGAVYDGQLATVYITKGTQAFATLLGGSGEGAKSEIGTLALGIPEPATMSLLAIGAIGLIRRKLA